MLGVLGSLAGALRRFVPEEIIVGLSRPGGVAPQLERPGPQHGGEEVIRNGVVDRVRLRQRPGLVATRQVEHPDMITRVHVERGEHCIRLQRHREEEAGTVGFALRMERQHPVIEPGGALLG